jgi:hypothetical protein
MKKHRTQQDQAPPIIFRRRFGRANVATMPLHRIRQRGRALLKIVGMDHRAGVALKQPTTKGAISRSEFDEVYCGNPRDRVNVSNYPTLIAHKKMNYTQVTSRA